MANIYNPIEQFEVVPLIKLEFFRQSIDLTITNFTIANLFSFLFIYFILFNANNVVKATKNCLLIIPNVWQVILEMVIKVIFQVIIDHLENKKEIKNLLPFIFSLFIMILVTNLLGLLPYSLTITSHLFLTFFFSFSICIGILIICFEKHYFKTIELFIPSNTSFALVFLLIPIEIISYLSRPISLAVRLSVNLIAGHCLLKVVIGFSWMMLTLEGVLPVFHFFPALIILALFGLELGVAILQSYVFIVLTCIYLSEANNL